MLQQKKDKQKCVYAIPHDMESTLTIIVYMLTYLYRNDKLHDIKLIDR